MGPRRPARPPLEQHGATIDELRRCEDLGSDGTRLPGCLKLHVPPPAGPWGFVSRVGLDEQGGFLAVLAFGLRHPPRGRRASVYQIAPDRLHRP